MKDFTTAVKAESSDDLGFDVEFCIDRGTENEREMVAYKPSDGQITTFVAMAGDNLASNAQVVSRSISFLYSLLERDDQAYLERRLLNRKDPFGGEDVANILSDILEEWTGKATGSRTASQRSRRPAGQSSTGRQRRTA